MIEGKRPKKMMGMADKAEKDLDQVSDCGWVRGLDINGSPIKIAKADLLFDTFKTKSDIVSNSDCNDFVENGIYLNVTGNGNGNSNFPIGYGILLVFGTRSSYVAQLSIGINEKSHIRLRFDSNWGEWKQISFI